MTTQLSMPFPAALHRKVRHRKAVEAMERADADEPRWSELAYNHLCHFARGRDGAFLAEEFIYTATANGLPKPANKAAFGAVFLRAARAGVIVRAGFSTATRNAGVKPTWSKA